MDAAAKHENRYRAVIEYANGAMFNVAELGTWAVSNKVPVSFEKLLKDDHISESYSAKNHFVHFEVLSITLANRLVPPEMDPGEASIQLFGPSGSGKSFLVLDLCAAIADGMSWFGRRVGAAPVTYVCLEGEGGLGKRAKAWSIRQRRNLPSRLRFITQPLDLRSAEDVADLCAAVLAAGGRDGLLVIDTLNRAAPGTDENSSVDMGHLMEACKEAQRRLGGMVLLVHHTGKDGTKGLRGHSSLHAALDAAIEVSRNDARREWSVAKSKDDADGGRQPFVLRVVELGDDEHGEPKKRPDHAKVETHDCTWKIPRPEAWPLQRNENNEIRCRSEPPSLRLKN